LDLQRAESQTQRILADLPPKQGSKGLADALERSDQTGVDAVRIIVEMGRRRHRTKSKEASRLEGGSAVATCRYVGVLIYGSSAARHIDYALLAAIDTWRGFVRFSKVSTRAFAPRCFIGIAKSDVR